MIMCMTNYQLPLPIFTPRLIIRDAVLSDMPGWSALYRDPEVRRYFGGLVEREPQDWWELLQDKISDVKRPLSIVLNETNELVGICGFLASRQPAEWEWETWLLLHTEFWGKGIGTEVISALVEVAFLTLEAQRVIGKIDPENQASLDLFIKLGFLYLGKHPDSDSWQYGHHIYGLVRPST